MQVPWFGSMFRFHWSIPLRALKHCILDADFWRYFKAVRDHVSQCMLLKLLTAMCSWSSGTMPWTMELMVLMHLLQFWELCMQPFSLTDSVLWEYFTWSYYVTISSIIMCSPSQGRRSLLPRTNSPPMHQTDSEQFLTILSHGSIISKALHFYYI